jgi:starch synthase (maltosyl-transferring)
VLSLDPYNAQEGTIWLDMPTLGLHWNDRFTARDEVTGQVWEWGQANWVRLEPWNAVAHIVSVEK